VKRFRWTSAFLVSLVSFLIGTAVLGRSQQDEQLATILDKISKTSQEGLLVLDRIHNMKPEVYDEQSNKTLIEVVQDYAFNKGAYNISIIGWEASPKKILPSETLARWKIVLYYRDWQKLYQAAEWEYNAEKNTLYPFEKVNAPGFFSNEAERPARRRRPN